MRLTLFLKNAVALKTDVWQ